VSEPRYITVWSAGLPQRLVIQDMGEIVELRHEVLGPHGWEAEGYRFVIPARGAVQVGDMAAALAQIWDERTERELAERAAKAAL